MLNEEKLYSEEDLKAACIHFCDVYIQSPSTFEKQMLQEVWPQVENSVHNWIDNRRKKREQI